MDYMPIEEVLAAVLDDNLNLLLRSFSKFVPDDAQRISISLFVAHLILYPCIPNNTNNTIETIL
jgi:hypothetical protein